MSEVTTDNLTLTAAERWAMTTDLPAREFHFEALLEAGKGRAFDVVIITAGKSHNSVENAPLYYSEDLLTRSASLFEGAMVNAQRFGEQFDHIWDDDVEKSDFAGNTVGVLEGVHFADGALRARLLLHEGADFMAGLLKLSTERETPLVGLSIDAKGSVEFTAIEGVGDVANVTELAPGPSVDIVSRPAAGGEIVRLAASIRKEFLMPEEQKKETPPAEVIPAKEGVIDLDAERARLLKESEEAMVKQRESFAADMKEMQEKSACGLLLERKLASCGLSENATVEIRESFDGSVFQEDTLDEKIERFRAIEAIADTSGTVSLPAKMELGTEPRDRMNVALDHLFLRNSFAETRIPAEEALKEAGLDPIWSLHKFCQETCGFDLRDMTGTAPKRMKLTESLTTSSWTDIFADRMNRALLKSFASNDWTEWRNIVSIQSLSDFRVQHSIRMGGFANLPDVSEGANYLALTSPGDEEHEWTPKTTGGTEALTRRMVLADDVGAIGRIPTSLAYAASRTLYEFVFDLITIAGQPTMDYDSTALYDAGRTDGNLGTTALSAAEVLVVWKAMAKYTDLTSGKRIGVTPRFVCVPVDLWKTATDLFVTPTAEKAPGFATDESFVKGIGIRPVLVRHWTNTGDHFYIADPAVVPGFLLGFVGGRQEPELFVQDNQNFGSVFDRDSITYKIRHEYGGSPVDHRAFYAENV
jgi:hypothetical protein